MVSYSKRGTSTRICVGADAPCIKGRKDVAGVERALRRHPGTKSRRRGQCAPFGRAAGVDHIEELAQEEEGSLGKAGRWKMTSREATQPRKLLRYGKLMRGRMGDAMRKLAFEAEQSNC